MKWVMENFEVLNNSDTVSDIMPVFPAHELFNETLIQKIQFFVILKANCIII